MSPSNETPVTSKVGEGAIGAHIRRLDSVMDSEELETVVSNISSECVFASAIQLSGRGLKSNFDISVGDYLTDRAVRSNSLFNVVCATKPVVATLTIAVIEQAGLNPRAPVRGLVARESIFSEMQCSFTDVLAHRGTLAGIGLLEVNMTPIDQRPSALVRGMKRARPGFSEVLSQAVCKDIVEELTDRRAGEVFRDALRRLGLNDEVVLNVTADVAAGIAGRVAYYVARLESGRGFPLLSPGSPHVLEQDRILLGGYASAAGLANFYRIIGNVHRGETRSDLPSPSLFRSIVDGPRGGPFSDASASGSSYVAGMSVGLDKANYGVSHLAFGQVGFLGMSAGMYNPESHTAFAFVANGAHDDPASVEPLRAALVRAGLRVLAAS